MDEIEKTWEIENGTVGLVNGELYVWMRKESPAESNRATRVVHFPATEYQIAALDNGIDPVKDGWEVKPGIPVSWENGIGWIDEEDAMAHVAHVHINDGYMHIVWFIDHLSEDEVLHAWMDWTPEERKTHRLVFGYVKDIGYWSMADGLDIVEDTKWECEIYFDYRGTVYYVRSVHTDDPMVSLDFYDGCHGTHFSCNSDIKVLGEDLQNEYPLAKYVETMEDIGYEKPYVECTKMITQNGTSLTISITKEAKALGLGKGSYVDVKISSASF